MPLRMESTKIFAYTVVFEKAKEGGYVAYVPLLPGCVTQGETFEEAKDNVKDAISGYISILREDGQEVPQEDDQHITATIAVPMKA